MLIERALITGKGQVQVPAKVRQKIGAVIGDELLFIVKENGEIMLQLVKKKSLSQLAGVLPVQKVFPGIDAEEELTRSAVAEKEADFAGPNDDPAKQKDKG